MILTGMDTNLYKVLWRITYKCNYRCPYCIEKYNVCERHLPEDYEKIYNVGTEKMYNILKQLTKDKKVKFELTGGEPTLLDLKRVFTPKILELDNLNLIAINTNCWRPIEWFEDLIQYVTSYNKTIFINQSLHETEVNDLYVTLRKFYIMQKIAKKYNCIISTSNIATLDNIKEREIIKKFGKQHPDFDYYFIIDHRIRDKEKLNKIGLSKNFSKGE